MDAKDIVADLRETFGKGRSILTPEEVAVVIGKTPAAVAGMRARETFPFEIRKVGARKIGVSIYDVAEWIANGCPAKDKDEPESGSEARASARKTGKQKSPPPIPEKRKVPASAAPSSVNRPSLGPALLKIKKMMDQKQMEMDFMREMFAELESIHLERSLKKGKSAPRRRGI